MTQIRYIEDPVAVAVMGFSPIRNLQAVEVLARTEQVLLLMWAR